MAELHGSEAELGPSMGHRAEGRKAGAGRVESTTTKQSAPTAPAPTAPLTFFFLFLCGLSFGIVFAINVSATGDGIPILAYVFWQSFGAALIVLALCAAFRSWPRPSWAHLKVYALTGALNLAIPYTTLAYVAQRVPSGVLSLGLTLVPILVYALALLVRIDRLSLRRVLGILAGFAGVLLVLVPRASLPEPDMVGWVLLGLVAPFCYALNTTIIALMRPPATGSLPLGFGLLASSALYSLVAMLASGQLWAFPAPFSPADWATIAAMANNAVSYVLVFEIIRRAGPVVFSTTNYIATLAGLGFGMWFFGDRPSGWIWAALALMFLGLFLVNLPGVRLPRRTV
jgi:drug/metabolite transporter (DMT)-like permease